MAYVEARPHVYRHEYNDAGSYRATSGRWNPKQQEVIVIRDSPSPDRASYNEAPSNNTRGATNKRRRLPASPGAHAQRANYGSSSYRTLQQPASNAAMAQYDPYGYGFGASYTTPHMVPLTSSSSQMQYAYPLNTSDYGSSYNSPFITAPSSNVVPHGTTNAKRKRDHYDDYSYQSTQSRHGTYATAQHGSTSGRHTRAQKKNKEVVLRKEPDVLPNFTGRAYDDAEGHYVIVPNTELTSRYLIDKLLGQGTFGKVVKAYDRAKRRWVAIKVIRAIQKYRDASMIELRVLRTLYENDPGNSNNCIHLQDCFDYRNHVCIVTELLNQSIFDFLKSNNFSPFPHRHIQHFAKQLFTSVAFLHDLDLIHTDLKPENILLVSNASVTEEFTDHQGTRSRKVLTNSDLRLIDFGSATFQDEYHSNVVSTRHYRAPEIILGMGWSFPCDIWSIGCILVEFLSGDALFQTHDNLEHLAMMEVVCGRVDGRIIRSCSKVAQKMFRPSGRLDYPNRETSKDSRKFVKQMKSLGEMLPPISAFNNQFCDLLHRIFTYNPDERITAKQALKHSFFSCNVWS